MESLNYEEKTMELPNKENHIRKFGFLKYDPDYNYFVWGYLKA